METPIYQRHSDWCWDGNVTYMLGEAPRLRMYLAHSSTVWLCCRLMEWLASYAQKRNCCLRTLAGVSGGPQEREQLYNKHANVSCCNCKKNRLKLPPPVSVCFGTLLVWLFDAAPFVLYLDVHSSWSVSGGIIPNHYYGRKVHNVYIYMHMYVYVLIKLFGNIPLWVITLL